MRTKKNSVMNETERKWRGMHNYESCKSRKLLKRGK